MLFKLPRKPLINPDTSTSELVIDGEPVAVEFRKNARARRLIMRLNKRGSGLVITVPPGISNQQAMEFAAREATWIRNQLVRLPDACSLAPAHTIPFRGTDHMIEHRPCARGTVWLEDGEAGPILAVAGDVSHLPRRLLDWLKNQARADLHAACTKYARAMNVSYKSISIRDTASRWGSCSSTGALSFSWRLVLAPPDVLDYVAAHEVAHLQHMDHSSRFWALVRLHCAHTDSAKRWLKANGRRLHRVG